MLAIFRREIRAYFSSPIGYIFVGFFILLAGVLFAITNLIPANPNYTMTLGSMSFIFLFVVPILTMRLLPDDARQKTDQLLITSPVSIVGIVVGKYLAAVAVFLVTLLITVLYPVMISFSAVGGLAWSEIFGCYIGFFLLGASFIAVGLFFSSVTDSQLIAAAVTFAALLPMYVLDLVSGSVPRGIPAGFFFMVALGVALVVLVFFSTRNIVAAAATGVVAAAAIGALFFLQRSFFEGLLVRVLDWFSLLRRMNDFNMGIFNLSGIVYYLLFSATFVFLTVRMIERKRWA